MVFRRGFGAVTLAAAIGLVTAGGAALVAASGGSAAPAAPAQADSFTVDPVHSAVLYRVKHLNTSWSYGRFNDFSGTFNIADGGSLEMTVKTESVDSGNEKRDGHLKSQDFFSAKEFPEMSFKSTSMKKSGEHTFEVAGQFTLKGVTKDVTVTVEKSGEGPGMRGQGKIQGFETKFTIKRSDYSMNFMPQALGDEVTVIVSVEGGSK